MCSANRCPLVMYWIAVWLITCVRPRPLSSRKVEKLELGFPSSDFPWGKRAAVTQATYCIKRKKMSSKYHFYYFEPRKLKKNAMKCEQRNSQRKLSKTVKPLLTDICRKWKINLVTDQPHTKFCIKWTPLLSRYIFRFQ